MTDRNRADVDCAAVIIDAVSFSCGGVGRSHVDITRARGATAVIYAYAISAIFRGRGASGGHRYIDCTCARIIIYAIASIPIIPADSCSGVDCTAPEVINAAGIISTVATDRRTNVYAAVTVHF
ncbi:hypothetical protein SDC9_81491 [bioreactor metagenome]|uniref:Uncharacterized protein n=1 Tax=bioreactor metagenome TaxID=1076179 RepID=A0A644Z4H7_9ZZZZ